MGGMDTACYPQRRKQPETIKDTNLGRTSTKEEVEVRSRTLQRTWRTKVDPPSLEVESAGAPRHYQTYRAPQPNTTECTVDGRVAQLRQKYFAPRTSFE